MEPQHEPIRQLVIFDMDYTICEGYLEEAYFISMSEQFRQHHYQRGKSGKDSWGNIIKFAVTSHPPAPEKVRAYLQTVSVVEGIRSALEYLSEQPNLEVALLSGGNVHLLETYFSIHNLEGIFDYIYANPSAYDKDTQTYSYSNLLQQCDLPMCRKEECKAFYLKGILKEGKYRKVFFVGDGINDFCCIALLNSGQAYLRKDKELARKLLGLDGVLLKSKLSSEPKYWQDGHQLLEQLKMDL